MRKALAVFGLAALLIPFISLAMSSPVNCSLSVSPTVVPLGHPTVVTLSWTTQSANSLFIVGQGDPAVLNDGMIFTLNGSKQITISSSHLFQMVAIGNNGEAHYCTTFKMASFSPVK